jgi:hypothetical protein
MVKQIDVLARLVLFNNQDVHPKFAYFTLLSYARLLHTWYNEKIAWYIWKSPNTVRFWHNIACYFANNAIASKIVKFSMDSPML